MTKSIRPGRSTGRGAFTSKWHAKGRSSIAKRCSDIFRKWDWWPWGRVLDNIFTERLWRSVKYEEVYLHEYDSPRAARKGLAGYFEFYNQERLHQSLGYRTPAEVYFDTTLQTKESATP